MSTMVRFIGLPRHVTVSVKEVNETDGNRVTLVVFGNEQAQREPVLREQGVDPEEIWRELEAEKERLDRLRPVDTSGRISRSIDENRAARRARVQRCVDALVLALHGCSRRESWAIESAIFESLNDALISHFPAPRAIDWPQPPGEADSDTADAT